MTVKILLLVLFLTALGQRAQAQVPPPANGSNAPSHDEVMRRALREAGDGDTNAVAEAVAPRAETPPSRTLSTAINRPAARPRTLAQATPTPAPAAPAVTTLSPTNYDEVLRRALRETGDTNAVVEPAAPRLETPPTRALPTATNRPAFRQRPAAPPAFPDPSAATQAAPAELPAPTAATTAPANIGGMAVTPHVSNAETISNPDEIVPAGSINFSAASLENVLQIYGEFVGRNVLRPATLPDAKIVLKQTTPLTKLEVVRAIEAAMYLNNVSVVNVGQKFVTVAPTADIGKIPGRVNSIATTNLADLGSVLTHIAQLQYSKPSELVQVLTPFASGTAANPIMPIDSSGILVLRDNVANVKRMLEMIERVDVAVRSEFVSEVIPIRYAKAEEIASALSSVGGGSGGTVGSRPTGGTGGTSGFNRQGGTGYNQPGANTGLPGATPTPTPSGGSAFSQNLQNIIRRAASSGDLQIFGTTKVIADIRSNSLLVFATREDMKMIKDIVEKLDVVLAQVLIETLIMDVTIGNDWNFGVSAAQTKKEFNKNLAGAGGMNANKFFDFAGSSSTNALGDLIGSGVKYFGKVNEDIYISVAAAASDGRVKVVQRPRIQTSHATPATLFIGSTVPYVTSTYYGGGYGGGPSSSYQQLKVGIGLNVTPFINQEGLVVMKIDETIDELDGSTEINGVGNVPNTKSSSLSAEIAVRDGESVILGGIVRNSASLDKGGVPYLKDIPLLGYLFRSTTSSKKRQESIVLMRPTVLRTPELAALQVAVERKKMPGISEAASEIRHEQEEAEAREAKRLLKEQETEARAAEKLRKEDMETLKHFAPPANEQEQFNQVRPFTPEEEKLLAPK
jgi:type II secretory pathway component GspD/PulD (secretin)